jgi:hypothetical protein
MGFSRASTASKPWELRAATATAEAYFEHALGDIALMSPQPDT